MSRRGGAPNPSAPPAPSVEVNVNLGSAPAASVPVAEALPVQAALVDEELLTRKKYEADARVKAAREVLEAESEHRKRLAESEQREAERRRDEIAWAEKERIQAVARAERERVEALARAEKARAEAEAAASAARAERLAMEWRSQNPELAAQQDFLANAAHRQQMELVEKKAEAERLEMQRLEAERAASTERAVRAGVGAVIGAVVFGLL